MSDLQAFDTTPPGGGHKQAPHWDAEQIIRDQASDMYPGDTPRQAQYMADLVINEIWKRKRPDGIRNALTRYWMVVRQLRDIAPGQFDRVLAEFVERASLFPECPADMAGTEKQQHSEKES